MKWFLILLIAVNSYAARIKKVTFSFSIPRPGIVVTHLGQLKSMVNNPHFDTIYITPTQLAAIIVATKDRLKFHGEAILNYLPQPHAIAIHYAEDARFIFFKQSSEEEYIPQFPIERTRIEIVAKRLQELSLSEVIKILEDKGEEK